MKGCLFILPFNMNGGVPVPPINRNTALSSSQSELPSDWSAAWPNILTLMNTPRLEDPQYPLKFGNFLSFAHPHEMSSYPQFRNFSFLSLHTAKWF